MTKRSKTKGTDVARRDDDPAVKTAMEQARATSELAAHMASAHLAAEETLGLSSTTIARAAANSGKANQLALLSKAAEDAAASAGLSSTATNYARAAGVLGTLTRSNRSAAVEALGLTATSMARELANSGKASHLAMLSKAAEDAVANAGLSSAALRHGQTIAGLDAHAATKLLELYRSPARDTLDQIASTARLPTDTGLLNDFRERKRDVPQAPDTRGPKPTESKRKRDTSARATVNASPAKAITSTADIGRRIRDARLAMGMTQQRFADLAGVGRRFLGELERGKASLEIGRVLTVCEAAGIKLSFAS